MKLDELITVSKPQRSHKSKRDQKRKTSTRILGGGFVERTMKPETHGETVKSRLIRVDSEFADWCRYEAARSGTSITEVTRQLFLSFAEK